MKTQASPPLRYRLAMKAYQAALAVLDPLVWRYFRKRGHCDADYLAHWDERTGQGVPFDADVWVHAVSLGEYRSAEPFLRLLIEAGHHVVLTHATPAGRRASETVFADDIAAGRIAIRYAPIDRARHWRGFFKAYTPKLGLVFEMEFWPGMIETAHDADVPLWLVNSQIPEKSFPRARRVKSLLGTHPAARADRVLAKSDRMALRFRELGASDASAMGETRFDIPPPPEHVAAGNALRARLNGKPVYTFASVVEGEEETYVNAARSMPDALIVWVPRAPELFDATFNHLSEAGLRVIRRSDVPSLDDLSGMDLSETDVLLGDSFGEMFFYLAAANVVSVGGGFVEKGAHNVIEPLALGKPVVTGPHVWTIEYPGVEAEDAGVLKVCRNPSDLPGTLRGLLSTGDDAAKAFHRTNAGATVALFTEVQTALGKTKP